MPSLLIVDDQPHIIRIMKSGLGREGYTVITAANGEQALEAVAQSRPDFVLTDIEMPLMDGKTFCERVHAEYGESSPHILIISGHYDHDMTEWLQQFNGKVQFHEKPVSMSRMLELLKELRDSA